MVPVFQNTQARIKPHWRGILLWVLLGVALVDPVWVGSEMGLASGRWICLSGATLLGLWGWFFEVILLGPVNWTLLHFEGHRHPRSARQRQDHKNQTFHRGLVFVCAMVVPVRSPTPVAAFIRLVGPRCSVAFRTRWFRATLASGSFADLASARVLLDCGVGMPRLDRFMVRAVRDHLLTETNPAAVALWAPLLEGVARIHGMGVALQGLGGLEAVLIDAINRGHATRMSAHLGNVLPMTAPALPAGCRPRL